VYKKIKVLYEQGNPMDGLEMNSDDLIAIWRNLRYYKHAANRITNYGFGCWELNYLCIPQQ
jgi:hypothetical protein